MKLVNHKNVKYTAQQKFSMDKKDEFMSEQIIQSYKISAEMMV